MCTVTFIPRDTGYYLAMNRDEQLARVAGLPPEKKILKGRAILSPSEPGGGTWIVLNETRTSFALINWYSVAERANRNAISRGEVVNAVSASNSLTEAESEFAKLPLDRINPFRLIGIFPRAREVVEWKWDLKNLVREKLSWKAQQWISSGYDEPKAQVIRGQTFQKLQCQKSAGTLPWLRRLHGSHSPDTGPFSTCMHRDGAATVSYTEVNVKSDELRMNYRPGPPCLSTPAISASFFRH
jgi:transport and Golgi organization protein 2